MLTQEQVQNLRAANGIPQGGIGQAQKTTSKIDELNAAWNTKPAQPSLADGGAGEFGAGFVKGIAQPLIRTGGAIEGVLDQTLGRFGNIVGGKGNIPTTTGADAEKKADTLTPHGGYESAGHLVGTIAPYFTGTGEEETAAKVASFVPKLAEHLGMSTESLIPKITQYLATKSPTIVRDATLGTAQTGDPVSGIAGGVIGGAGTDLLKSAGHVATSVVKNTAANDLRYAVELGMPKATAKESATAIAEGRVTAPGILRKATIKASPRDNLVGESIADVVSPKNNITQNVDAIQQKISQVNGGVRNMLADHKVPFNMKQLKTRLNSAKADSKLVFASDATAERTYDAVVDEFLKSVKKGDTLGLFEARQSFDKIPAIRKLLDTGGLGENVRRSIVLDVRRAANEYIAEQLPKNNPYRTSLMKESHMIDALGNIAEKNASIIGKNKLQILTEQYPILNWLAGLLVGAGGVGVGGSIINSTD